MTYKELWEQDHPGEEFMPGPAGCPYKNGYTPKESLEDTCFKLTCTECWDRKIPEKKTIGFKHEGEPIAKVEEVTETADGALARAAVASKKAAEDLKEMVEETAKKYADGIHDFFGEDGHIPAIKDSGDRTEFETGAVRDMREGKGRCDLMPLEVVADLLPLINDEDFNCTYDPILASIAIFKRTNDTKQLVNALHNFAIYAYDRSRSTMLLEVAKHFEEGAKKYGENNWQKGMPVWCYIDSAVRHYLKWLRGDTDEPHDRAFVWNLMCCIWEVDYHKV